MVGVKYDPAESERLEKEAREDDERMPRAPWNCVPLTVRFHADDRPIGSVSFGVTRTRNNLRAIADQLAAGRAEIVRLSPQARAEHLRHIIKDVLVDHGDVLVRLALGEEDALDLVANDVAARVVESWQREIVRSGRHGTVNPGSGMRDGGFPGLPSERNFDATIRSPSDLPQCNVDGRRRNIRLISLRVGDAIVGTPRHEGPHVPFLDRRSVPGRETVRLARTWIVIDEAGAPTAVVMTEPLLETLPSFTGKRVKISSEGPGILRLVDLGTS